jgi:predicted small lipoprotein YifL
MKRLTSLIAVLSFMFLYSACGQSGPLYIPGNPSQMAVPPSQQPVSEEEPEEDNGESSETD